MKGFIFNTFDSIVYCLMFSGRALLVATIMLITTLMITYFTPNEIEFLTQSISFMPFHMAIYTIGGIYAVKTFVTIWIKDYKNEYIPRWMLD